ncbi:MAG: MinD/ParA family protein [Acidobacteria bacterium]|nr:MinD/ParA family protein [Acidobacteriota bacterium]
MRRIISISSGKGGVGKTTFAINFALSLSQVAPTILLDLDTGTSSVRNTIDTPVTQDLYHFFRRGARLDECLTTLDARLDPAGNFKNFAFVAGPRHVIDEITNMREESRWRLMQAINGLDARYIVLDLKAGLDANVIDYLPLSNSSILVFTPHHPAATLAAGDIVKSLLFRKLRFIFAEGSPFFGSEGNEQHQAMINGLLNQVEDVYDERLKNLDDFMIDLYEALGDNPYLRAISEVLNSFGVYFVLNMFDGIEESYQTTIRPFVEYLRTYVSAKLHLTNLGWVVNDARIHEANCQRRPILLQTLNRQESSVDAIRREIASLESSILGLENMRVPESAAPASILDELTRIDPTCTVERQLEILQHMYHSQGQQRVRENFAYITHRALHVMQHLPPDSFGHPRLFSPLEIFDQLMPKRAPIEEASLP